MNNKMTIIDTTTQTTLDEIEMNIDDYKIVDSTKYKMKKRKSISNDRHSSSKNVENDNHLYSNPQNYTLMNKLLKEQNIYSDPKDYYVSLCLLNFFSFYILNFIFLLFKKRRTITINRKEGSFGFDLQVRMRNFEETNTNKLIILFPRVMDY